MSAHDRNHADEAVRALRFAEGMNRGATEELSCLTEAQVHASLAIVAELRALREALTASRSVRQVTHANPRPDLVDRDGDWWKWAGEAYALDGDPATINGRAYIEENYGPVREVTR